MNILIIDDNNEFIEKLKNDLFYHFCHFYEKINFITSEKPLENIEKYDNIDFAFFDIDLPEKNGILFAKEFRDMYPKTILIFISSHTHLVHNTLVVRPFYFIRKTTYKKDMHTFFELINDIVINREVIDLYYNTERSRIFTDDIIYVEAQVHKLIIHTTNGVFYDNHSLKGFLMILPSDTFIRIHKSFIINSNYLTKVSTNNLVLNNTISLNIGRFYKDDFEKFYKDFLIRWYFLIF